MKKSAKTKTPKKEDAHKKSCKLKNELECNTKDFALDLKSWTESLTALDANIDQIDKVIQKTATMTPQELSKTFSDTQLKLDRIKTKIEAQQKAFNDFQTKFEKILASPFKAGLFNGLKEEILKEVRENIAAIQAGITANTQSLSAISEKSMEQTRKLVLLEESVTEICLPDEIEKIDKLLKDKLIKHLTALCEMTAPTKLPENDATQKATATRNEKLKKPFLQAYGQHCEAAKLFELIRKNIRIAPPEEEKSAQPEVAKDAVQPDKAQVTVHTVH